jgi:hypothetical protein
MVVFIAIFLSVVSLVLSEDIMGWTSCQGVMDTIDWPVYQNFLIEGCKRVEEGPSKWPYRCREEVVMESMSIFHDIYTQSLTRLVYLT